LSNSSYFNSVKAEIFSHGISAGPTLIKEIDGKKLTLGFISDLIFDRGDGTKQNFAE
jgi:hypothetical protein